MVGPPGSGKTMLARRLPTILPPLTLDEALEATKIYSIASQLPANTSLLTTRPFRLAPRGDRVRPLPGEAARQPWLGPTDHAANRPAYLHMTHVLLRSPPRSGAQLRHPLPVRSLPFHTSSRIIPFRIASRPPACTRVVFWTWLLRDNAGSVTSLCVFVPLWLRNPVHVDLADRVE